MYVLKGGEPIFHIDRVVKEIGNPFGDGTHIIYVNGSYKSTVNNALGDLIHDFFCANSKDMRHKQSAVHVTLTTNT